MTTLFEEIVRIFMKLGMDEKTAFEATLKYMLSQLRN